MAGAAPHNVKGTHIIQLRLWIERNLGEGSFVELTQDLPHQPWVGTILASTWYDASPIPSLLRTASVRTGHTVEIIATEVAEMNARHDLVSVYRAFLRVAGPHLTLAATPKLWRNYVAFADATAATNEPGNYVGECHNIPKDYVAWACGCWMGFICTAIEISGGKKCAGKIAVRQRQEGSDFWMLRFTATYQ